MRRVLLPLLVVALSMLALSCGESGVGDPCNPQHPPLPDGGAQCPNAPPGSDCFLGTELYLETRSLQCRTRVCMVYHWSEREQVPGEQARRVFCTCRCGGEGDPTAFCTCPSGFRCTVAFVAGEPGIRGSYCVRCEALPAGMCDAGM